MDQTGAIMIDENELGIRLANPEPKVLLTPNLGVIGVGGAGGNAVNNMVSSGLNGCAFFVANTDAQVLSKSLVADKIQLGEKTTKGLGAGSNPDIGRASAEESAEKIKESIKGLHLLFLTAGMGGGTGTGAIPEIARMAKEMGILTVGVVSTPFFFEGPHRMKVAKKGIEELQKHVDTLIVVPNQNLFRIANKDTKLSEAFKISDDVLCQGVRSITDLVMNPGMVNLDFADVRTVLTTMGRAMMGTGTASGENRAEIAADQALTNPLLDDSSIKGAKSVLINISGGLDMTLSEVDQIMQKIVSQIDEDANVKFGSTVNEALAGSIQVSIVATGLKEQTAQKTVELNKTVKEIETPISKITIEKPIEDDPLPLNESEEEEPILINSEKEIKPIFSDGIRNVSQLEKTITPDKVFVQNGLFLEDAPPVIEMPIPLRTNNIAPEIEISSSTSNVKKTKNEMNFLDKLLGRGTKIEEEKDQKNTASNTSQNNDMTIPDFFKKR